MQRFGWRNSLRWPLTANDGVHGCELHVHAPDRNETVRVTDLHPNGDALPGRDLGIHAVRGGSAVVFDATDGVNGRQLWVNDGTTNGTQFLGAVEAVAWFGLTGLPFRSTANELVWTNGSDLRAWTNLPSWDDDLQENVAMNLSGLDNVGQAWLHADERAVYFSASDGTGDVEPYRLDVNGVLTAWTINEFGSAHLADFVSLDDDAVAGGRGG